MKQGFVQADVSARGSAWPAVVLLSALGVGLVLGFQMFWYGAYFADDAMISLRYADRLLAGKGLTWNDGEYVEGYTNLLWVLSTAALGWTGLDLVVAARAIGLASLAVVLLALHAADRGTDDLDQPSPGFVAAAAFIAATPAFAVWAVGGLEAMMVAAVLAVTYALLLPTFDRDAGRPGRRTLLAGLVLVLGTVTRADFPLLVAAIAIAWVALSQANRRERIMGFGALAGLPLIAFLTQTAIRLAYYGEWLPNTFYAKFAVTEHRFGGGVTYLGNMMESAWIPLAGLIAVAIGGAVWGARGAMAAGPARLRRSAFIVAVTLVWIAYVVMVGGDFFPAFRHGLPVFVAIAMLFIVWGRSAWAGAWTRGLVTVVFLVSIGAHGALSFRHPLNELTRQETWVWPCKTFSEELKRRFEAYDPTMAVAVAGCLSLYTGFRSLDMFGLNDHDIARRRPPEFGNGLPGHELLDVDYVVSRRPDFIVMFIGDHPRLINAFQPVNPEFLRNYTVRPIFVPELSRTHYIWARNDFWARAGTTP